MVSIPAFMKAVRCGPPHRYQNCVYWACEGLVICQDERPGPNGKGDWRSIRPDVFEDQLKAVIGYNLRRHGQDTPLWQKLECQKNLSQLRGIEECLKEARRMGDPSSPEVQAFWAKHRPGSKSTVSLSSHDYAEMPILPPGRETGLTAEPTFSGIAPRRRTGVYDEMVIHQKPRRKQKNGIILL